MKDYEVKFRGIEVNLGSKSYIIPPLNLLSIETFEERMASRSELSLAKQISLMIDIIHCAILRNYPDVTRDEVGQLLDISNVNEIFMIVVASSGLVNPNGQEVTSGEEEPKK